MTILLLALVLVFAGGLLAVLTCRRPRLSTGTALAGLLAGSVLGFAPAIQVLARGETLALSVPWSIPLGSFSLALDPLSAWFLLPILVLSCLAGIYGASYLQSWNGRKNLGACWFFFNTLVVSMALVLLARNGVLFLFIGGILVPAQMVLLPMFTMEMKVIPAC